MIKRIKLNKTKKVNTFIGQQLKSSVKVGNELNKILEKVGLKEQTPIWKIPKTILDEVELLINRLGTPGTKPGLLKHNKKKSIKIEKLIQLNAYRGRRLKKGYPSRGQRTSTNAKTARQNKITIISKKTKKLKNRNKR